MAPVRAGVHEETPSCTPPCRRAGRRDGPAGFGAGAGGFPPVFFHVSPTSQPPSPTPRPPGRYDRPGRTGRRDGPNCCFRFFWGFRPVIRPPRTARSRPGGLPRLLYRGQTGVALGSRTPQFPVSPTRSPAQAQHTPTPGPHAPHVQLSAWPSGPNRRIDREFMARTENGAPFWRNSPLRRVRAASASKIQLSAAL